MCPGLHSCPWTSLAYSISSVYGPDQHTDSLHRVEAAAVVGPEDPVLEFAAVNAAGVPDTVEIGLAAGVVPPASFMEMGAVTCRGEAERVVISSVRKCVSHREKWWNEETHLMLSLENMYMLAVSFQKTVAFLCCSHHLCHLLLVALSAQMLPGSLLIA